MTTGRGKLSSGGIAYLHCTREGEVYLAPEDIGKIAKLVIEMLKTQYESRRKEGLMKSCDDCIHRSACHLLRVIEREQVLLAYFGGGTDLLWNSPLAEACVFYLEKEEQ